MVVTMDLNVSPVPEGDEDNSEGHVEEYSAAGERSESAVETARRVFLNSILAFCFQYFASEESTFVPNYGVTLVNDNNQERFIRALLFWKNEIYCCDVCIWFFSTTALFMTPKWFGYM